jgi:hypothetical protein
MPLPAVRVCCPCHARAPAAAPSGIWAPQVLGSRPLLDVLEVEVRGGIGGKETYVLYHTGGTLMLHAASAEDDVHAWVQALDWLLLTSRADELGASAAEMGGGGWAGGEWHKCECGVLVNEHALRSSWPMHALHLRFSDAVAAGSPPPRRIWRRCCSPERRLRGHVIAIAKG